MYKIKFTKNAIKKILKINKKKLYFRIYIIGGGCNGFKYEFIIEKKIKKYDIIIKKLNIIVLIDYISIQYLKGSKLDYLENLEGSKFMIKNPNAKTTCSCGISFSI
ncbi:iron-sulfur cluster insertion protein ErpA [Buchnera aphidicola (Ceratoglyphina bambusae)]|uniref:iron-sulfur cluster insertion protein ErpA n=1 Tax=Buchnera aphidicola TaxID=9 RepID=UPI0031B85476